MASCNSDIGSITFRRANCFEFASTTVLAPTTTTPQVTIGGQPATVQFSGLTPGLPGLYQVNVYVPTGISAGTAPISLTINGATTQASTLPVN